MADVKYFKLGRIIYIAIAEYLRIAYMNNVVTMNVVIETKLYLVFFHTIANRNLTYILYANCDI